MIPMTIIETDLTFFEILWIIFVIILMGYFWEQKKNNRDDD